jgi:hypothetical protein
VLLMEWREHKVGKGGLLPSSRVLAGLSGCTAIRQNMICADDEARNIIQSPIFKLR